MWRYRCVRYWYRRKSIRNRRYIIISFYLLQTSSIFLFTANLQHSCKKRKNILIFVPCVRKWNRGLYNTWCWWPASWRCFLWLSLTIITGTGCLVINPWPRSKRMAIKAQIRMIAVATGITWPISVRIFFILWMEMWIYIWCRYSSYLITSTWPGVLRTAPWSRERPLHWVAARRLDSECLGTSCPSYVLISRLWEWVRTDLPLSIYY